MQAVGTVCIAFFRNCDPDDSPRGASFHLILPIQAEQA
jgi:hypothetical protein